MEDGGYGKSVRSRRHKTSKAQTPYSRPAPVRKEDDAPAENLQLVEASNSKGSLFGSVFTAASTPFKAAANLINKVRPACTAPASRGSWSPACCTTVLAATTYPPICRCLCSVATFERPQFRRVSRHSPALQVPVLWLHTRGIAGTSTPAFSALDTDC